METVIVFVIAGIALALAARWFYRTFAGKSAGCGCGETSCPHTPPGDSVGGTDCCN